MKKHDNSTKAAAEWKNDARENEGKKDMERDRRRVEEEWWGQTNGT